MKKILTLTGPTASFELTDDITIPLDSPKIREVYNILAEAFAKINELSFNKGPGPLSITGIGYAIENKHDKFPNNTCEWCEREFETGENNEKTT